LTVFEIDIILFFSNCFLTFIRYWILLFISLTLFTTIYQNQGHPLNLLNESFLITFSYSFSFISYEEIFENLAVPLNIFFIKTTTVFLYF